jgi:hypothetical protein
MPGVQNDLTLLREYLNRELAAQSTINRVVLLWASAKLPGLLKPEQQESIIKKYKANSEEMEVGVFLHSHGPGMPRVCHRFWGCGYGGTELGRNSRATLMRPDLSHIPFRKLVLLARTSN